MSPAVEILYPFMLICIKTKETRGVFQGYDVWKENEFSNSLLPITCTDLDDLTAIHLHQLTEVLLEEAGVGAPLQQAKQVDCKKSKQENLVTTLQTVQATNSKRQEEKRIIPE